MEDDMESSGAVQSDAELEDALEDYGHHSPDVQSVSPGHSGDDMVDEDANGDTYEEENEEKFGKQSIFKARVVTQVPKTRSTPASWNGQTCVKDCRGPRKHNPCPIRAHKPTGNLSCVEVHELIRRMGVEDPSATSACVRAAILRGHIRVTGSPADLDMFMFRDPAPCSDGHYFLVRLRDVLFQPDYPGADLRKNRKKATIKCQVCYPNPEEGPTGFQNDDRGSSEDDLDCGPLSFVFGMCRGMPYFNRGKLPSHCRMCSGFGSCAYDHRAKACEDCGFAYSSEIFRKS